MTHKNTSRACARFCTVGLAALGFAAATATTLAAPAIDDIPTLEVSYSDLDLSRSQGAQTLYSRLQRAARIVCQDNATSADGRFMRNYQKCYDKAISGAVRSVGRATLTALHQQKTDQKLASAK